MAYSKEVESMVALIKSFGILHRITDVNTPDIHSKSSYHYQDGTDGEGLAVDIAGPLPYSLDPIGSKAHMLAICAKLVPFHEHIAELICSHLSYSIKNGTKIRRIAVRSHWNHIHLAVKKGVFLFHPITPPEVIVVPDNPDLPNIEGPLQMQILQNQDGQCTGYAIFSIMTGELHGFGPGWKYYGRSEDTTPDDEQ